MQNIQIGNHQPIPIINSEDLSEYLEDWNNHFIEIGNMLEDGIYI
jgi:hypothetical protein